MSSEGGQTDYDVIVAGAGNAGLTAALAAHEAGARVVVLEAASEELRGGNTYFTGGGFRVVVSGLDEVREMVPDISDEEAAHIDISPYSQEQYYDDWMKVTEGLADSDLVKTVTSLSNPTIRWAARQGVEFELYWKHAVQIGDRRKWMPGNNVIGAKREGPGLSNMLFGLIEQKGIDLKYDTRAAELLVDRKGGVCGLKVKGNETYQNIRSKAVVLACGGFEANREMRAGYLGAKWEMARIRGTKYNMGNGIKMALKIGAQPAGHWGECHGSCLSADAPFFPDKKIADRSNRLSYPFGIMVNIHGKRFFDEGMDLRVFTYSKAGGVILGQPKGIAFQIFDDKVKHLLEKRYEGSVPPTAGSIAELADKLGLNKANLVQTVEQFNSAVQDGIFDPAKKDGKHTVGIRPPKSNWAQKLDRPPYRAYGVTGGITFTYGGIKINSNAQVLDTEGRVIPGLYAAGELVGGLFFYGYLVSGLMAGQVFGRLAGAGGAQQAMES